MPSITLDGEGTNLLNEQVTFPPHETSSVLYATRLSAEIGLLTLSVTDGHSRNVIPPYTPSRTPRSRASFPQ